MNSKWTSRMDVAPFLSGTEGEAPLPWWNIAAAGLLYICNSEIDGSPQEK